MLPWHLHIRAGEIEVETLDSVRYAAALAFARSYASAERSWPELEKLQLPGVETDPQALVDEVDRLVKLGAPERLAGVLGSLRDDALKAIALAEGVG